MISILIMISCGISCCLLYSINYNHSEYVPIFVKKRELNIPKLKGIMETPQRANTLEQLINVYKRLECDHKIFLTTQSTPLLHYIFDKKAP